MQTFLPYADFAESARVLDRQRLGKQRVETLQIMKALVTGEGWIHHPATKMWAGHEDALMDYQIAVCAEWVSRGYKDTCLEKTFALYQSRLFEYSGYAPWHGDEAFHLAHQSNLLRKDPEHYGPLFPGVPDDLEYVWPVR
jgi:hypothetical protein